MRQNIYSKLDYGWGLASWVKSNRCIMVIMKVIVNIKSTELVGNLSEKRCE